MVKNQRSYTKEFKQQIVDLYTQVEKVYLNYFANMAFKKGRFLPELRTCHRYSYLKQRHFR